MNAKVQKWGNSLAVRIPKSFAKEAHLAWDTTVDLSLDEGKIVIDPNTRPEFRLDDLLKGVTKRNIHSEIDTGASAGREVW